MAKILVTGVAGFIGSHVSSALIKKGHQVVGVDDLSGGFLQNVPKECEFINASILDKHTMTELFEAHKFDYVYHLAAYAAEGLSHFIRRFNYENNLIGSVNLINLAVNHNVRRFVFTSSMAVYGSQTPPFNEDMPGHPEDPYGAAKFAVEYDLKCAKTLLGLDYTIFRPHNVYGPGQNIFDRYRNVVGIFMNQVINGKPMTVFGSGSQTRAFSYIDDIVVPLVECIEMPSTTGEVFNIGADTPYSILELANAVGKVMKMDYEVKFEEARFEVEHAYVSHDKVKKFFEGHLPHTTTLEEGLSKMAEWVKIMPKQPSKIFANIEIKKNMPSFWLKDFE